MPGGCKCKHDFSSPKRKSYHLYALLEGREFAAGSIYHFSAMPYCIYFSCVGWSQKQVLVFLSFFPSFLWELCCYMNTPVVFLHYAYRENQWYHTTCVTSAVSSSLFDLPLFNNPCHPCTTSSNKILELNIQYSWVYYSSVFNKTELPSSGNNTIFIHFSSVCIVYAFLLQSDICLCFSIRPCCLLIPSLWANLYHQQAADCSGVSSTLWFGSLWMWSERNEISGGSYADTPSDGLITEKQRVYTGALLTPQPWAMVVSWVELFDLRAMGESLTPAAFYVVCSEVQCACVCVCAFIQDCILSLCSSLSYPPFVIRWHFLICHCSGLLSITLFLHCVHSEATVYPALGAFRKVIASSLNVCFLQTQNPFKAALHSTAFPVLDKWVLCKQIGGLVSVAFTTGLVQNNGAVLWPGAKRCCLSQKSTLFLG